MRAIAGLLCVLISAFHAPAQACTGLNSLTKKPQKVRVIYRTGYSHPRRFIAESTYDKKTGRPLIIYYRRFNSLPGYYKRFVRMHECCHHTNARRGGSFSNEVAANCCALRSMRLSRSGVARIRKYMISKNINSDTAIDYAGQGVEFWNRTAAGCPGVAK